MTSSVNVYRSTDTGAPTLTGVAGSLTALLDAVLVNGYGSKPAAGWTIAYTGTNQRVYTMASGGTGFSLYINDAAPGSAGGQEARACGFKAPTGLGAGTGQFPSTAQAPGPSGVVIRKSLTSDSTVRAWTAVADGHTLYLFTENGDSVNLLNLVGASSFAFGDFFSYSSTDVNNCMIIGRIQENYVNAVNETFLTLAGANDGCFVYQTGQYVAASWTGLGGPVPFGKVADTVFAGQNNSTQGEGTGAGGGSFAMGYNYQPANFPYPNGPDGALWLSPVRIVHSNSVRGYLKGIWCPLHHFPLNHDDTFTISAGNLSGKSMLIQAALVYAVGGQRLGQVAVETSNTWS